jgi:hypothetical protein
VADVEAFGAAYRERGGELAEPAHALELAPYGRVELLAIKAPNGARLEFFSAGVRSSNLRFQAVRKPPRSRKAKD